MKLTPGGTRKLMLSEDTRYRRFPQSRFRKSVSMFAMIWSRRPEFSTKATMSSNPPVDLETLESLWAAGGGAPCKRTSTALVKSVLSWSGVGTTLAPAARQRSNTAAATESKSPVTRSGAASDPDDFSEISNHLQGNGTILKVSAST